MMNSTPAKHRDTLLQFLALTLLLLAAGYFRFTGLTWGDYEYQHPDERFLIWVVADIAPVESLSGYFDTATSSLNPVNRGHGFYVYGDFPVIATRYLAENLFETVGWMEVVQVGRGLSAFLDLLTVLIVYLIAERLAGWKVGVLAGLFSAAAVLQIQQAHFFTSDSFAVFFSTLTIYFGVLLVTEPDDAPWRRILGLSLLFGAAVGMAMACKINTAVVAALLPAALFIRLLRARDEKISLSIVYSLFAVAGGVVAFLVFRVAMPYAFSGPGFFGLFPDERWMASLKELSAQSAGDVDFPPGLQWARRSKLFSLQNLVLWGLGLPLGLLAWTGFFLFLARAVKRLFARPTEAAVPAAEPLAADAAPVERSRPFGGLLEPNFAGMLLVGLWTGAYFLWQSMAFNPTMRYQLPIYPTLAVFAAWGLGSLWSSPRGNPRLWRAGVGVVGAIVLALTLAWAYAFTNMYTRTESRLAASHWIYENVPGPINLEGQANGETWKQMLVVSQQVNVRPGSPYLVQFDNGQAGTLASIALPATRVTMVSGAEVVLRGRVFDPTQPQTTLAVSELRLRDGASFDTLSLPAVSGERLEAGKRYTLAIELERADGTPDQPDPNGTSAIAQFSGAVSLNLYGSVQTVTFKTAEASLGELRLDETGTLRQVRLPEGSNVSAVTILLQNPQTGAQQIANAVRLDESALPVLKVEPAITVDANVRYDAAVTSAIPGLALDPSQPVMLDFFDQPAVQSLPGPTQLARASEPLWSAFSASEPARLERITLAHAAQMEPGAPRGLTLELFNTGSPANAIARARVEVPDAPPGDPRGGPLTFTFDAPVQLELGQTYNMSLTPEGGAVAVRGSAPANETTWDMGLPFRSGGYDPYGGIYRNDLNFEMYWDDSPDKYQRFLTNLDQADYIFISSNRQWGTTTRVPERYPLTTLYYRELLGCPEGKDVIWCYNVAEEGTFEGRLGFELVKVVTSYPRIGPLEINTQFAEEAFTVYDHPKVFIFKKSEGYNQANVRALLGSVDLTKVVHVKPKEAAGYKDLLLPAERWVTQQAGGTWAQLFPPEGLLNRAPALGAAAWYLFLLLLGALTYPMIRLALPGLPDRGYPLARTAGLVLLAYLAWISGSLGVQVTRSLLLVVFGLIAAAGIVLTVLQREGLAAELRERRGYFLAVEGLALGLFAFFLLIRLANPDLWHPVYGGEKPMDFSYFNAVLKSSTFPPYDPWFAGGYINYYYYGFVLVGMPVKLLGINPTVAYNLILPALFMMIGLGAFSVGSNLFASVQSGERPAPLSEHAAPAWRSDSPIPARLTRAALWTGLIAVLGLLILGNLGTVRMYWRGFQKIVVGEEQILGTGPVVQTGRFVEGLGKFVRREATVLPYHPGDWYWKPSRAIQPESGNEITEFPFFTFLYADLHAHLMALPVTILVIGWALGVLLGKGCWGLSGGRGGRRSYRALSLGLALLLGALATGMLRPANTWDQYTYLALAAIALFYTQFRAAPDTGGQGWQNGWWRFAWLRALLPVIVLVGLALLLYRPFDNWFAQGYNSLEPWKGAKTAITSYLVHWGLFLFVIAGWLFEETVRWMAETPLSALSRLRKHFEVIGVSAAALLIAILVLFFVGVRVALIAAPLGIWVTVLLFRPGQPAAKRAVLFMTGTALALTLAVEMVAVKGDIGRMNTVFKFYYQAWTMLALSAAAGLAWLWPRLQGWAAGWRNGWLAVLGLLVFSAALFPVHAAQAKIADRMIPTAPRTLDGMQYMNHATYSDGPDAENFRELDLSADYRAIRWAQANIPGSPVIVEAHTPEYRHWGTRFTIYTGLPGVVGWNWHQRQQRTITPDTWVYERVEDVGAFYRTTSTTEAVDFLRKYNVQYIILAQLERTWYAGPGLAKFTEQEGTLWEKVYEEGETVIYRVK